MQKENTQEETMLESDPIIVKDYTKADRLMKSEAARARRKNLKETLETKKRQRKNDHFVC